MLFPATLDNITLTQWIDYTNSLKPLDEHLTAIHALPDCERKRILLTKNLVDRAYHTYEHWGGKEDVLVDDVLKEYTEVFCKIFEDVAKPILPDMPSSELTGMNPIEFGQFIDAKMITSDPTRNKWELMQYIMAIFCSGKYKEVHCDESNEVFVYCGTIPMDQVLYISQWWEKLNTYINENYTLFQDSGEDEGANMKEHMQRWGWINFLKTIAKTKVFDIAGSGLNSIDCARRAKCDDVLTWASEEKDYNIAAMRDMEASYNK